MDQETFDRMLIHGELSHHDIGEHVDRLTQERDKAIIAAECALRTSERRKAARDDARADAARWREQCDTMATETGRRLDELAAQAGVLREALAECQRHAGNILEPDESESVVGPAGHCHEEARVALLTDPPAALAALEARIRREALLETARAAEEKWPPLHGIPMWLRARAEEQS